MPHRSNQDWLDDLAGKRGKARQRLAHQELGRYLYTVTTNHLRWKAPLIPILADLAPSELDEMAQDFVQATLEKLSRDDFALLRRYGGHGRFLAWAAQVVLNEARGELRRLWRLVRPPEDDGEDVQASRKGPRLLTAEATDENPEQATSCREFWVALETCLHRLPERQRLAFWACEVEQERTEVVCDHLGVSVNAVYILVWRARRQLRRCLTAAGWGPQHV